MKFFADIKMLAVATVTVAAVLVGIAPQPASAARIRDLVRLQNEVPNELVGMGLIIGLKGTGDGGDFLPAMRPLKEMMKHFDNPVQIERELKNANNVAIVTLSMKIPEQGVRAGEKLDVHIAAIAAKSLKGGQLFLVPMIAPQTGSKMVLASASGKLILDDENNPTTATIRDGGVVIQDILPEEIKGNSFSLVLHPNTANMETAQAIADRINEEVSPQTGGQNIAVAVDGTCVAVRIPRAELANTTGFISRIRTLPMPNISGPAKVLINTASKTIVFTDEVELSPTMISQGNMTITVATPTQAAGTTGGAGGLPAAASLKDLETAFNLMKVSPDDRITIVKMLHDTNALKADLQLQ